MERQNLDTGLTFFIKKKLEQSVSLNEITEMLLRAGFSQKKIDDAIQLVRGFSDTHQDVVASNDFLPPLKKKMQDVRMEKPLTPTDSSVRNGLFEGRLRRRDFILSFLFFFGIGVIVISFLLGVFSFVFPQFITFVDVVTSEMYQGLWLVTIPVFLGPLTILILSLISRRLHDLGMSGWLSIGFLIFFISPNIGILNEYGVIALQGMMSVIFLILLAKKGDPKENKYGAPERIQGSMFLRIFRP